jgi:hypothetical protein
MSQPKQIDARLELLALRLGLYGADGIDRRDIRALARSHLWVETRNLLRQYGFTKAEVNNLMGQPHPVGCACWRCVIKLNRAARDHLKRLMGRTHDSPHKR